MTFAVYASLSLSLGGTYKSVNYEKTESALTNVLSASHVAATSAVQSQCTPVNKDVDKAVKEALSHQENRRSLVISGIKESISQDEDARFVKDLFSYLGEKDVVVVDCFRLGKPLSLAPHLNHVCSRSALLTQTKGHLS